MKNPVFKQIKQYRNVFILTPVLMVISGIFETMIPLITTHIIDDGISAGDMNAVFYWGKIMLVLALGTLIFAFFGYLTSAKASSGLAANLREAVFEKIQSFSFADLDRFGVASLVTRTMTDVTNIQNTAQTVLTSFFRTPVAVIYALYLTTTLNRRLSFILLIGVLIITVFLSLIIRITVPIYQKVYGEYDRLNGRIQENVTGIRIVKSFVREKDESESFDEPAASVRQGFIKVEKLQALNNPVMMIALEFCFVGISWIGARYISAGDMTTGDLAGFINYAFQIMTYISTLVLSFVQVSASFASFARVREVLITEPSIKEADEPVTSIQDNSVEFDHVSFRYGRGGGLNVLDDICLKFAPGEMIGIVGATGSSKSSLVNLISRLYDVTEGSVKVGGKDVREYSMAALSDRIAVVLQKNVLFSGTIMDNLRWGRKDAGYDECSKACAMACADTFIEEKENKYDEYIEQGGSNLSGGQRQRLCLARALVRKPGILILDDALSALDNETEARILHSLKTDMPDVTKILITQRVASIHDADRILVMDKGRVNGFGTHEELIETNEIYRDLCGVS
ncbi:MAG: ABC transporter ATP-binding protein/permease [Lachnospiraceae bacterium]|nr:ABC transporter ATP-binding protein/permease [Lachnospiraceae bacterium]